MLDHLFQLQARGLRRSLTANPIRNHHPRIQRRANNRAPAKEFLELTIVKLAIMWRERSGVGMARPDRSLENIHRLPETRVAKMRRIEDESEPAHHLEQFATAGADAAFRVCPKSVGARSIMRWADRAQPLVEAPFEMLESDDRVCTFKTKNIAHRLWSSGLRRSIPLPEL